MSGNGEQPPMRGQDFQHADWHLESILPAASHSASKANSDANDCVLTEQKAPLLKDLVISHIFAKKSPTVRATRSSNSVLVLALVFHSSAHMDASVDDKGDRTLVPLRARLAAATEGHASKARRTQTYRKTPALERTNQKSSSWHTTPHLFDKVGEVTHQKHGDNRVLGVRPIGEFHPRLIGLAQNVHFCYRALKVEQKHRE